MNSINKIKDIWAQSIVDQNINDLLSLYSKNALLNPTLSNEIRQGVDEIRPYFDGSGDYGDKGFLNRGITKATFTQSKIINFENSVVDPLKYVTARC